MSASSRFHLMKWLLDLLLLRYCYRKTFFQHLNRLVHIFFGLKSQFLSHENENMSPWQRNYLIKTLQQLFGHVSHYCPVPPQLACVSEKALMIAWFCWVFSSLCPLSTDLIPLKIGKISYCASRNVCCVMCNPGFSFLMQKNADISFEKCQYLTLKYYSLKGNMGEVQLLIVFSISCQENYVFASVKVLNICKYFIIHRPKLFFWGKKSVKVIIKLWSIIYM